MSFDGERERNLIVALATGRMSEAEFCRELPTTPDEAIRLSLRIFTTALRERDPVGVESGLILGHRFGFGSEHFDLLVELAHETWHQSHEDVVDALATFRSPSSVETLVQTALSTFDYLDYDESYALGVKCIWALGEIESESAVNGLGRLRKSSNSILESEATAQLVRLKEDARSESIRVMARQTLEDDG